MGEQESVGNAWGDTISETRQAELKALADKQHEWTVQPEATRGDSVFKGVKLTGADVFWLAEESGRDHVRGVPNLHLEGTTLSRTELDGAHLGKAHLEGADLVVAYLEGADLSEAHLEGADLSGAQLDGARLIEAHLEGAALVAAHLDGAFLIQAHLEGANLKLAHLEGADLRTATLDKTSHLNNALLTGVSLDQVTFDNVNLTVVDWSLVPVLGDELAARNAEDETGKKDAATRQDEYVAAVRANRVLAVTLRSQGMTEDADHYAYRAQLMQRVVLRRQAFLREKGERVGLGQRLRKLISYVGSGLLDLIAGYGYRPGRSILAYIVIICTFAGLYLLNGQFASPHLRWDEALVLSISSFHGRGFFTTGVSLGDTLARLAAGEAILGLLLEITFIATFTNRFFAR